MFKYLFLQNYLKYTINNNFKKASEFFEERIKVRDKKFFLVVK